MNLSELFNIYILIVFAEYLFTKLHRPNKPMPFRPVFINLVSDKVRLLFRIYVLGLLIPGTWALASRFNLQIYIFEYRDSPLYFAALFAVAFFIYDLYWYFVHILNHRSDFLWSLHQYHHSSQYFNHSLMGRIPTLLFFEGYLGILFLIVLGFPAEVIFTVLSFTAFWVFFTHSDYLPATPVLSRFLITPYDHSKHHEADYRKQNSNFGNCLSIFDHLFGTYSKEPKTFEYGCGADYNTETIFEAQLLPAFRYFKKNYFNKGRINSLEIEK